MPSDRSGILPAEAELLYINEVERLDGFGQEIFPVKVASAGLALRQPSEKGTGIWETGVDSSRQDGLAFSLPRGISWQVLFTLLKRIFFFLFL